MPWWQSIHPKNIGKHLAATVTKASANEDQTTTVAKHPLRSGLAPLANKASTKKRTKEPMAAKHPPWFPRRPSIQWGRRKDSHYDKVCVEGSDHDTLNNKASAKEETNDNGGKVFTKRSNDGQESTMGESDSCKASATKAKRRWQCQELQDRPL